jgi:hypothetical protein
VDKTLFGVLLSNGIGTGGEAAAVVNKLRPRDWSVRCSFHDACPIRSITGKKTLCRTSASLLWGLHNTAGLLRSAMLISTRIKWKSDKGFGELVQGYHYLYHATSPCYNTCFTSHGKRCCLRFACPCPSSGRVADRGIHLAASSASSPVQM